MVDMHVAPGTCPDRILTLRLLSSSSQIWLFLRIIWRDFFFFNTNVKDPTPDIQIQVSGGAWEMLSYFKNSPDESHGQLMLKSLALESHTFV